jgi:alcohol dehydrogenase, propanol-preferring
VANMTREDARDFLKVALEIGIKPKTTLFPLEEVNAALNAVYRETIDGAAVVLC